MEQNKEQQDNSWIQKLKQGLNNPKAEIWDDNKKLSNDDEIEFEGQKKYEKVEMTPELQEILNKGKLERIQALAEEAEKRKIMLKEANDKREKELRAISKKDSAEKKKVVEKIKLFQKSLQDNGIRGFDKPQFDDNSGLVIAETVRPFKAIFDKSGNLILGADDIAFGDNGLFYINDKILNVINLYHYSADKNGNGKLELIAEYNSEKEMIISIYSQDPKKTLGFRFFMHYQLKKEADEYIRVSKLTPKERQKEIKDIKKQEADAKQKQMQLEKEKLQKLQKSKLSGDDDFDKLFGN